MEDDKYYLQDSRSYVGNDILFWLDGGGYTTNLREAEVFTKEAAVKQHQSRETDIPWPKEYIDGKTRPAVDMQYVDREVALQGTGIELIKPEPRRNPSFKCGHCGCFCSEYQFYNECPRCGNDNRP